MKTLYAGIDLHSNNSYLLAPLHFWGTIWNFKEKMVRNKFNEVCIFFLDIPI